MPILYCTLFIINKGLLKNEKIQRIYNLFKARWVVNNQHTACRVKSVNSFSPFNGISICLGPPCFKERKVNYPISGTSLNLIGHAWSIACR